MGQEIEATNRDQNATGLASPAKRVQAEQAPAELSQEEQDIWTGGPSQWLNFGSFILFFWTIIVPIYKYFVLRSIKYRVSTERIFLTSGLFSVTEEEIELYRVKDTTVERPFLLRLVGLCNVVVSSSDPSNPRLVIKAIKDGKQVREQLRTLVERCRIQKGVREVDYV